VAFARAAQQQRRRRTDMFCSSPRSGKAPATPESTPGAGTSPATESLWQSMVSGVKRKTADVFMTVVPSKLSGLLSPQQEVKSEALASRCPESSVLCPAVPEDGSTMDQAALDELWCRTYAAVKSGSAEMADLLWQFHSSMASPTATIISACGTSDVQLSLYATETAIVVNGVPKTSLAKEPKVRKRASNAGNPNFVKKDTISIQLKFNSSELHEMTDAFKDLASKNHGDGEQRKAAATMARLELLPSYCVFVESRGPTLLEVEDPRAWLVEETRNNFHDWLLDQTSAPLTMEGNSSVEVCDAMDVHGGDTLGEDVTEADTRPPACAPTMRDTRLRTTLAALSRRHATRRATASDMPGPSGPLFVSHVESADRAVHRRSNIKPLGFDSDLLHGLATHAGKELWDRLIVHPEGAIIMGPEGNPPRPDIFFNTGLKFQYGRTSAKAKSKVVCKRVCCGCLGPNEERMPACDVNGADCTGCEECAGRYFRCPDCRVTYQLRPAYALGSGSLSVNPDMRHFKIGEFTKEMEEAATKLNEASRHAPPINSCSIVGYLGADFCAPCALGLVHGKHTNLHTESPFKTMPSKMCASELHLHRDRANGENTQSESLNRTLSLFSERRLTMRLFLRGKGEGKDKLDDFVCKMAPWHTFALKHGTAFHLDPMDERELPRLLPDKKTKAIGYFKHGVVREREGPQRSADAIECGGVSAAMVWRHVVLLREVCSKGPRRDYVILTRDEKLEWDKDGDNARKFNPVRAWWVQQAPIYASKIKLLLATELDKWKVLPSE